MAEGEAVLQIRVDGERYDFGGHGPVTGNVGLNEGDTVLLEVEDVDEVEVALAALVENRGGV